MVIRSRSALSKNAGQGNVRRTAVLLCTSLALVTIGTISLPRHNSFIINRPLFDWTVSTPVTAVAEPPMPVSRTAKDVPFHYGPAALMWTENGESYRAVHNIAHWEPYRQAWIPISPDLTEANIREADGQGIDGITTVAHSGGTWYVGTLVGTVEVKLPEQPWVNVSHDLPARSVTGLAICSDVTTGQMAAVGYGGYSSATPLNPGHVYVTFTGGRSWIDLSGDLPDAPVESVHFYNRDGRTQLWVSVERNWYTMGTPGHWNRM